MLVHSITDEITQYIAEINRIFRMGNATEHTYRPAMQSLLEQLTNGLTVTNEPKRIDCGAPDYIVSRNEIPVGYVEAKDIDTDLNSKASKAQFDRYKQSLDNLIITDYLSFQLFESGELITSATIATTGKKGIEADKAQFETFIALINRFAGYDGKGIKKSEQLSKIMATKARLLASIIAKALEDKTEDDDNSLAGQLKGFSDVLIHDITHKEFADIYAQTIAYGMFAAKLSEKTSGTFTRSKAAELIPHSNPFLRKLFQYIAGYDLDERICWVVDDLASLFNHVDIQTILKEFYKTDHDPMVHFYETFLAEYDPALRKSRGVWYTPQPVVQFMVQAVDDILKQDFGLSQGLADTSKIRVRRYVKQGNEAIAEAENEYHRVQILDPATGTGTFLAEVVQNIYRGFKNQQGMWQSYASEHLIPRINGFEILMASYAMAHLKLDMTLQQTGYKPSIKKRLHIYLTNSLEEAKLKAETPLARWLSDEANEASRLKQDVPIMVILGNPPYSISSQNKGRWINDLLIDYKQGLNEKNIQPLSDDYIKFIRFGQHFVENNGEGVLAYISNNSFIDGLIHSKMRKSLLKTFDKIYILDLHGNAKKKETAPDGGKDENVFDIQQGVSINIFVKTSRALTPATVYHCDLYGLRDVKYCFLLNNTLQSILWQQLKFEDDNCFFVPKDFGLKNEYEKGFKIDELFSIYTSGITTADDNNLVGSIPFTDNNQSYAYRPFDIRNINYDLKKVSRHRYDVMKHFIRGENIGLLAPRQAITGMYGIFLTTQLCDRNYTGVAGQYGLGLIFPLYVYLENIVDRVREEVKRTPNLKKAIIDEISLRIGLQFTEEKEETENTFAPIDLLDYIYAVLHSPTYRERYREFLKIDFPRVPYPESVEKFWKLVELGGNLRRLHLLEGVEPQQGMADFPVAGSDEVGKLQYVVGKVYINDTQYFDHVPPEAWNFYIGGYQPAPKWLKDRKGRKLNYEDIQHYQKMIYALKMTDKIMNIILL